MGDVQSLILELRDTATNAVRTLDIAGVPHYVVKDGYKLEQHPELLPSPLRPRGHRCLLDLPSFTAYFNRFKNDASLIYANTSGFPVSSPTFTGILNENVPDKGRESCSFAHWRDYACSYTPVLSVEWKRWMAKSGVPMSQEEFLNHLSDNMTLIASPKAADLLSLFEQLRGSVDVRFESARNLFNGKMKLHYVEDVRMTGGAVGEKAQDMEVPSELICGIQPFEFGDVFQVINRLRYRVVDKNKLTFVIDAMDTHKVLEKATREMVATITQQTECQVLMGMP